MMNSDKTPKKDDMHFENFSNHLAKFIKLKHQTDDDKSKFIAHGLKTDPDNPLATTSSSSKDETFPQTSTSESNIKENFYPKKSLSNATYPKVSLQQQSESFARAFLMPWSLAPIPIPRGKLVLCFIFA